MSDKYGMRLWEIFDQADPAEQARANREKQARETQKRVKAQHRIIDANASRNDALRRCQTNQKKASEANDPTKAADAMRKFENARRKADEKARAAKATLAKVR